MKIRIAVAVDPTGAWCAYGNGGSGDEAQMDVCVDAVQPGEARYWIEADVQVPMPAEIAGDASAAARCLDDAKIDAIAEQMPGGIDGFLKHWGWRQFARAIEDAHGVGPNE